jgi:ribosomal protein S18 acetylase RimI-like enzyme
VAKPFFELEEMIVDAWPAAETCDLDGWLLRASGGPTRRGNSVATLSCSASDLTLEDRIARAEAFYRERAQPALFQVGPCVQPKELDATLSTRGYEKTGEAAVMVAAPEDLARDSAAEYDVRIERTASAAWSQIALHAGRFANATDALDGALRRLGSRVRFVTGYEAGVACATCYLIASEDRLGIYGMLTLPASRRRGAARDLLRGIGSNAQREQVSELYLMVEHANTAARALYVHSGFRDLYNYHYRGRAAEPDVRA